LILLQFYAIVAPSMNELVRKGTLGVTTSVLAFDLLTGSAAAVSTPEDPPPIERPIIDEALMFRVGAAIRLDTQAAEPNLSETSLRASLHDTLMYGSIMLQHTAVVTSQAGMTSVPLRSGR
jgi:hypothetical protein